MKQFYRIILVQLLLMLPFAADIEAQETFWRWLERPYGGNGFSIITAPEGTIYAATERSGLYRSFDEGGTWTRFGPTGELYDYARPTLVTPEGAIFIATDDRGGIFRSTDDGVTWARTAEGALAVHPRFMARTKAGTILLASDSGLFRSTNNGDRWGYVGLGSFEVGVPAVAPDGTIYLPTRFDSLFRSTDDGETWIAISADPVRTIVHVEGAEIIGDSDGDGIYRSTDSGRSFDPFALQGIRGTLSTGRLPGGDLIVAVRDSAVLRISRNGAVVTTLMARDGDYLGRLTVTPSGTILLEYKGRGILRSTDEGASFQSVGVPYAYSVASLGEAPDGSILAGGSDGNIFRSSDRGATWTELGLPGIARHIGFTSHGTIITGGPAGQAFRSTDNGATWTGMRNFRTGYDITGLEVVTPSAIVMSSMGIIGGILRSADDGRSWQTDYSVGSIYALTRSPNGDLWGVGHVELFRSSDDGATWTASRLPGPVLYGAIKEDMISPADGVLLLGVTTGDSVMIFRSTDEGTSWDPLATPTRCTEYGMRFIDRGNGELLAVTGCGILSSTDAGRRWTQHLPLPENEGAGELFVDSGGALWFGGRSGIYTTAQPSTVLAASGEDAGTMSLAIFPNPGGGEAQIGVTLPTAGNVTLSLHTLLGETSRVVHEGHLPAGNHVFRIDRELPAGAYLIHLRAGDRATSTMMHVVK